MVSILVNKLLLLLFFLSVLTVIRHAFLFIQAWISTTKYKVGHNSLLLLGIAISYIMVGIINGIFI